MSEQVISAIKPDEPQVTESSNPETRANSGANTKSERTKPNASPLPPHLDEAELAFFTTQTGITDEVELKTHIREVQAEAYKIYPYPCVGRFTFTRLKIARYPAYEKLLELGRERDGAIFLDVGCCFGNDVRKAVADGYPVQNVVATDLHPELWDLGHRLFRSTAESFPVAFVGGNIFDPAHLEPHPVSYEDPASPVPPLSDIKSLTPLQGHVSAIHASSLFHLFSSTRQTDLAKLLGSLLVATPGSMIFGSHIALPEKRMRTEGRMKMDGSYMFCHSPESWEKLWNGEVFEEGRVSVETMLREVEKGPIVEAMGGKFYLLIWSVTRL